MASKIKWKRLIYTPEGKLIQFPIHLFFFITLMYGLAFILPPAVFGLNASTLFTFSVTYLPSWTPMLWGSLLVLTTLLNTAMLLFQETWIAKATAMLGFLCWGYAFFAYSFSGFWLGVIALALPNLCFWAWYYFRLAIRVDRSRNAVQDSAWFPSVRSRPRGLGH